MYTTPLKVIQDDEFQANIEKGYMYVSLRKHYYM